MPVARAIGPGWLVGLGFVVVLAVFAFWTGSALAADPNPPPDAACRGCHADNTGVLDLPSDETLALGVDLEALAASVHSNTDPSHATIGCTDCHRNDTGYRYPHVTNQALSRREFKANIAQACQACHQELGRHNPGHLLAQDPTKMPLCTDCHGGHDVAPVQTLSSDQVGFCQSCHQTYADAQVARVHAEIAPKLEGKLSCRTCHADTPPYPDDTTCRTCHRLLTSSVQLPSGEQVSLHQDGEKLAQSVHGERMTQLGGSPLRCTDCHRDAKRYAFPHTPLQESDLRHLTLDMEVLCQECHTEIAARERDSVHAAARKRGELEAATCADCHGSHAIQPPNEPRERISATCGKCHSTINAQYAKSVHGAALLGEENPDVPVCIDCHGVHNIASPETAQFRAASPNLCAGCHADATLMAKYNISTDVFNTYVADFHGTTVELFEKQTPWQETNKAVCYDCHGIHNILPPDDAHSQVIKQNLVTTCRQCHPDANANFPAAWTSHFEPSPQHNALVYYVNLFYTILIPAVVGGFLLLIGSDVYRRTGDRLRAKRKDRPKKEATK